MSSSPCQNPSPSKSQTDRATSESAEELPQKAPTSSTLHSAETPQPTAGQRSHSTPPLFILDRRSITSNPRPAIPLVPIHNPRSSQATSQAESTPRQGRPLVARHLLRTSSSQPPRRVPNPYARPASLLRARSQPRSTMSSASTPSNTSTAGASGSGNPSYQLPYAPFPYPMPANSGSGQQGGKGGSGK